MKSSAFAPVRKLESSDVVCAFDCGQPPLNIYLQRFALMNQKANSAQIYVCCKDGAVAGYYSLAAGSVGQAEATERVIKGLARHPVPVMILARLAIDKHYQSAGLGRALLKDAVMRTAQAADIAGIRSFLVHAKDDAAREWYLKWGFESSPTDIYHLFLLIKDIKSVL